MRRVAITGATGTIGRALVVAAQAEGWSVRALSRRAASVVCPNVDMHEWTAPAPLDPRLLSDVDVVCHLAAFIPADMGSSAEARKCLEINALGTLAVLEAAATAGVGRFVLAGSGNTYATGAPLVDERAPLFPVGQGGWYLSSKVTADLLTAQMDGLGGMHTCTLRISSVYGPGVTSGVVSRFARELLAGRRIVVHGGGRHRADYVLLADVVVAFLRALDRPARGPVNIGSGVCTSVRDLAQTLVQRVGSSPSMVAVEPGATAAQGGFTALDITRARDLLGYRPTSLHDGLGCLVDSLRKSPSRV